MSKKFVPLSVRIQFNGTPLKQIYFSRTFVTLSVDWMWHILGIDHLVNLFTDSKLLMFQFSVNLPVKPDAGIETGFCSFTSVLGFLEFF